MFRQPPLPTRSATTTKKLAERYNTLLRGLNDPASGAVQVGSMTSSGLTIGTGKLAGRTTAETGALEEIAIGYGLSMSAGSLTCTITPSGVSGTAGKIALFNTTTSITSSQWLSEADGRVTFGDGASKLNAYPFQIVKGSAGASRFSIEQHTNDASGSGIYLTVHNGASLVSQASFFVNNAGVFYIYGTAGSGAESQWVSLASTGMTVSLALTATGVIRSNSKFNVGGTDGLASQTVVLAKTTAGGANGSITITGGIVTAYTAPT